MQAIKEWLFNLNPMAIIAPALILLFLIVIGFKKLFGIGGKPPKSP